jgi:hypothetical protein
VGNIRVLQKWGVDQLNTGCALMRMSQVGWCVSLGRSPMPADRTGGTPDRLDRVDWGLRGINQGPPRPLWITGEVNYPMSVKILLSTSPYVLFH